MDEKSIYGCHICGNTLYLTNTNENILEYICINPECSRCHGDYKVVATNEKLEQETINIIKGMLDGDPKGDHSKFDKQLIIFLTMAGYTKLAKFWYESIDDFWNA